MNNTQIGGREGLDKTTFEEIKIIFLWGDCPDQDYATKQEVSESKKSVRRDDTPNWSLVNAPCLSSRIT